MRRRFRGQLPLPNIGYGSNRKTRHVLPNGLKTFVVTNMKELEALIMHTDTYSATIASCVGSNKRSSLIKRAEQLGIKVANKKAKAETAE